MAIINTPFDEMKFDENNELIPEVVEPPQPLPEQPEQAVQPEQPTPQQQPVQEQQEPVQEQQAAPPEDLDNFDVGDIAMAPVLGVADFAADAAGFIGFKGADKWWDDNSPRNNHPWVKTIRDLSAIIIPTLLASKVTKGGLGKAGAKFLPNLGKKQKMVANFAAELGADAGVAAISSQTGGTNIAGAFNESFGTNIPWASTASDSPDHQFAMNMAENTGIGGLAQLVSGFLGSRFKSAYKVYKAGTDIRTSSVNKNIVNSGDEAVDSMALTDDVIKNNQIDEGVARLEANPTGAGPQGGHDPYISVPAEDVSKPAQGRIADPVGAKADQALISTNTLTTDGVPRPMTTEGFRRAMAASTNSAERKELVESIFAPFSEKIDIIADGKKINAEQVEASAAKLRDFVYEMEPGEFEEVADVFLQNLYEGQKILGREGFAVFQKTFRNAFDELINPDMKTASAFLSQEAAVNAGMAAKAFRIVGGFADPTSQGQKVLQNLHVLAKEMRFNQYVSGQMLSDKNIIKTFTPEEMSEYLLKKQGEVSEAYLKSSADSKVFFDEMIKINKSNPKYLRPMYEVFEASKYEANTFNKMIKHMENRTGVIGKAFYDGKSEVPSFLIKELESLRYNQVLFGKAIVNTFGGNSLNLLLKPISVFSGSLIEGNFKEAMYEFGGIQETLARGFKMMKKDWNLVTSDPASLKNLARNDINQVLKNEAEFDAIENLMETIRASGDQAGLGRVMAWNATKVLSHINKSNFMKTGINVMTALDGMVKSVNTSWTARQQAYRELMSEGVNKSSAEFKELFNTKQRAIYAEAFDEAGNMTNKAAEFASKEMTLQLDNRMSDTITAMTAKVPALKPIFMFPRTGVNALEFAWSFTPTSGLLSGIGKAQKVFRAQTFDEVADVLGQHGIKSISAADDEIALAALRSEYRGRQMMGSAVIMSAALWAANGNLRGAGPRDAGEARRMRNNLGYEPFTIKSPLDGKWYSYQNFEPFSKILGLIGSFTYEATRVDEELSESWFRKLAFALSSNVTNSTFMSGLEPLTKLIAGDEAVWTKLMAREADTMLVPLPRGLRSIMNNVVMPQVIDVENDFLSEMKKQNKFLFGPLGQLDQYNSVMDGKPINYMDPMNAAMANLLPFFKVNGDQSPQQAYLQKIAFTGLSDPRTDLITQEELSPKRRQWINNYIGKYYPLNAKVDELMQQDEDTEYWSTQVNNFRRSGQGRDKKDWQIKNTLQHRILNDHLNKAYKAAFNALAIEDPDLRYAGQLKSAAKKQLQRGEIQEADRLQTQAERLIKFNSATQ